MSEYDKVWAEMFAPGVMTGEPTPPFSEGELVQIVGNEHIGVHRVDSCEWYVPRPGGAAPYWLVRATQVREPIDWSKIPAGATGIVTHSCWSGSADHLIRVTP